MNERLIVRSFGPVKDLDITFKKVTIFIGDQGTGKSCIAKLFSMFKWLEKVLYQKRYNLDYFQKYKRFKSMLCKYHRIDNYIREDDPNIYIKFEGQIYDFIYEKCSFSVIDKHADVEGMPKIMYVPAERSIVSVAEGKSKLLKELPDSCETFSDEFVNAKKAFKAGFDLPFEGLRFEYDSLNDTGWIKGAGYKVRLTEASSGIQSSLPMCMVTDYLSQMIIQREEVKLTKEEKDKLEKKVAEIMQNNKFSETIKEMMIRQLSASTIYDRFINIVEEPELNLFPQSQMDILFSLVASNSASTDNMLVMTTHSPYSLAIVNTMIMAGKAYANADEEIQKQIEGNLPHRYHLVPDDIAAYRLAPAENEYCKSVINPRTGLISKNDLDAASDDIMRKFNLLYQNYATTLC